MLSISNIDILDTLEKFKKKNLRVVFIVPTKTGLKKSIMDATLDLRILLKDSSIHDYQNQEKGPDNKVILKTTYISKNEEYETDTSFYRPLTKHGDPRIWIYGLKSKASAGDLLGAVILNNKLTIINCSNSNVDAFITSKVQSGNILNFQTSPVAIELLNKLKNIASKGFIKSMRAGDTGVGYTLETLLGIKSNSSQNPDYKGIELKSIRKRNNKGTFFSRVPNWKLSNIKSAEDIVKKRGKKDPTKGNLKTIHHTISALKKNSYNMKLVIKDDKIIQVFLKKCLMGLKTEEDVTWLIDDIAARINQKHKETFWIDVETIVKNNVEYFKYNSVLHTSLPDPNSIPILIQSGSITVDYLIRESKAWKEYSSKNGNDFLWKIKKKDRDLLFKFTKKYNL